MKEYYKKENLEKIIKESLSLSEVLRKNGLCDRGNNFNTLSKYIKQYGIDTSHFTGQSWNKNLKYDEKSAIVKIEEILNENTNYKSDNLKYRLIKNGLKENKCECCGLNNEWQGQELKLELHHINGDHYDNRLENLQILCPNCHSQTKTFRRRKSVLKDKPLPLKNKHSALEKECEHCGKVFIAPKRQSRFCSRECYNAFFKEDIRKEYIDKEKLINAFQHCKTITDLAKFLNTSRPTIKKYLQKYELYNNFMLENTEHILHSKSILQYDLNNNLIKEWGSITDAEETLHIYSIGNVAKGKRRSAGGFIWRYKEDII